MKRAWTDFLSSTRGFLPKRFLNPAAACLVFLLGGASQTQAQSVASISGVAGFETGLQVIASVDLAHEVMFGDLNPPGATIDWGDGTASQGLLSCTGGESDPCDVLGTHWYTLPTTYTISITYSDPAYVDLNPFHFHTGPGAQHTLYTSANITAPWNDPGAYVIVSIGDSIASGEGNPNVPASNENYPGNQNYAGHPAYGFWDDLNSDYQPLFYPADEQQAWPNQSFPCHRSSWAGPAQAAQEIQANNPGVTFIHYSCSGAKVSPGDTDNNAVQDAVNQLRIVRQRVPRVDLLLISAGANNLHGAFGSGFGQLVQHCLVDIVQACSTDPQLGQDIANSLAELSGSYARLASVINCIDPDTGAPEQSCNHPQDQIPKMVLITEYMDPTHDQNGNYPDAFSGVCPGAFDTVSNADWMFFHDSIVHPLNQAVDSFPGIAQGVGFPGQVLSVGIEDDFLTHGICAGSQRWVYDITDSEGLLGPDPHDTSLLQRSANNGAGHPIAARYQPTLGLTFDPPFFPCCGQEDYRDRSYTTIVRHSLPVTTATATVGGAPYTFGTWAFPEVVVTLTASNRISEAGVQQTVYAVDDPTCNAVTSPTCLTYAGPFTISTLGRHTVAFSSVNAAGWPATFQTVQVWINSNQSLTITANNASRQYGAADPTFGASYSGFQNGDTPSVLTGTLTCTSTDTQTSPVGTYSINCSGLSSPNYSITYAPGTLTVTQAPLTVTANSATRQYAGADPTFTASYIGFVNGDTPSMLTGTLTCSSPDTAASPVGTYSLSCSGLSSPNYNITYAPGTVTVTQVPLTVTASNSSRLYGQANPPFTGTIAGLQNGDNITANYATGATPASPAGNYAITATLVDPSGRLGNYAITFNNGTLTVTAAPLTITANNASRQYGAADPSFASAYSGFVNGDTSAALAGTLTCAANDTAGSPAGTYAITCSGLSSSNYSITYASGTLSITAAPLTITANNASRQYGQANPPLNSATYSGLVNGDTSSSLVGILNCTTTASQAIPVGVYPITCAGLSSQNYSISFVSGTLTVTVAPLTITAANMSKTYGATLTFAGTEFTVSGLLNADKVASVTLASPGTPAAAMVAGSPYTIAPSAAVGTGLGNYNISYMNGTLMVTPALLTITSNNSTKTLNAPNPTFNWSASGFVNGENTSVLTANPTCTTTAITTSPVGSYPITCAGATAANYVFSYVAGTLRILYATSIGHVIQPPINADGSSVFNQGRTVPAKFDVYDANGVPIGTPGVVSSFFLTSIISGTVTATVEDVVDTNNPDTSFRWDGQEWIFNITTANLSAGSTYVYIIALNDGSTIMFQFGLR